MLDRISALALPLLVLTVILRDTTTVAFLHPLARGLFVLSLFALAPFRARRRWPFLAVSVLLALWVTLTRDDPGAILNRALDSGAFVAAFFAALGTLRHAAELSPAITRAAQYLADRPPGRRYLALMAGGQAFSLLLGYGAISLLGALVMSSTADEPDAAIRGLRRKRMLLAVQHGFVSCIAWSPLSFGMILALSLVPGSDWVSTLPLVLVVTAVFCLLGWGLDQVMKPPRRGLPPPDHGSRMLDLRPLVLLLALLGASLILFHSALGLPASVSVMILVPLLSLFWMILSPPPGAPRLPHALREARVYARDRLPTFGGEITLLGLASFLGTAGGLALAPLVARIVDLDTWPATVLLVAMIWLLPLMGYLGAHPMLTVSLVYPLLPAPADMGVAPAVVVCAITAGWAISGATSPFTAATLLIGRFAGAPPLRVGAIWNGPFTLAALALSSLWIVILTCWA